ncbi:hypothetical protein EHM76_00745 [bacterium]|nr:MAG: hypothetical protein EHM76_00745 [bacterium]
MESDNAENKPGFLENAGSKLLSSGIVSLKKTSPEGWKVFKTGLKCVKVGAAALDEVTDDDRVSPGEIQKILQTAQDYGATRTLEDMLFGLLKHVRG